LIGLCRYFVGIPKCNNEFNLIIIIIIIYEKYEKYKFKTKRSILDSIPLSLISELVERKQVKRDGTKEYEKLPKLWMVKEKEKK
jgi:hypothetical protein